MYAEPTMANNAEDIENNMVSMTEMHHSCFNTLSLFLSMLLYWVIIGKQCELCVIQCFRIESLMKEASASLSVCEAHCGGV